jgi:integrase
VIHVRRGWDDFEGEIAPKSEKGTRTVPVPPMLRRYLLEHRARTGRRGEALFFGRTEGAPFTPSHVRRQASKAWATANVERAEKQLPLLESFGLHEARHTYVSLMHAAGISLERIGDYIGHASAYMTERYRHLIEGHEAETADQFEAYLTRSRRPVVGQLGQ